MKVKTYKSSSIFGLSLKVEGFGKMHIRFTEYNMGGSYYTTSDANVQAALEGSENFNKKFFLAETVDVAAKEKESKKEAKAAAEDVKKIEMNSLQDAKEYLSMYYNIPRSTLRTKTAILAAAKEHNIEFVGI